ncbi:MAG: lipid-A-disaccharide synthase [Verrucomicrobiales bacterium]|nr:lipid-A-disaccharide synthase [Verrucomicrobiales bacterium]MCP5526751.1 lipid-A-disaccharide synthase [Verrucomicrobiales bacterium]
MNVHSVMLVAGETSGDLLAAELVGALRPHFADQPFAPRFFGAGGSRMEAAGVDLAEEMTRHAVVGLGDVLRSLARYRRIFQRLLDLACARQPELIVLVDFTGFNRRFAQALRRRLNRAAGAFGRWRPRIVQYVSPQVWASRPGRAYAMAKDLDLLLCLFPFEQEWYARRLPDFPVQCVGHPICDRYPGRWQQTLTDAAPPADAVTPAEQPPLLLLLPGSRTGELKRHLGVMLDAAKIVAHTTAIRARIVLPERRLEELAIRLAVEQSGARQPVSREAEFPTLTVEVAAGLDLEIEIRHGALADSLAEAAVAIASTGTVTLECALFGVPTVAIYKTSWGTYQIGRRVVTVRHMAMPNLLAGREIFPEFIQDAAIPKRLAPATLEFLGNPARRRAVRTALRNVVRGLGGPGASQRAAAHLAALMHRADRVPESGPVTPHVAR